MIENNRFRENEELNSTPSSRVNKILKKDTYSVESLTSESLELTPEVLAEISDFFRYTFNNAFPEYLVCMDCDIQLSAPEVFVTEKEYVDLEFLDDVVENMDCPGCSGKMEIFHDKETVSRKIQKNLGENAHVSLLRNETNQDLEGITFAYFDTFKNAFEKEWSNEYLYMKQQDPKFDRDGEHFLQKINGTLREQQWDKITEQSEVLCWNCTAVNPKAQGLSNMLSMVTSLFDSMEKQPENKIFILETRMDSTAHKLLRICGAINVLDVFDDEGQVFMIGKIDTVIERLTFSFREILNLRRQTKK